VRPSASYLLCEYLASVSGICTIAAKRTQTAHSRETQSVSEVLDDPAVIGSVGADSFFRGVPDCSTVVDVVDEELKTCQHS